MQENGKKLTQHASTRDLLTKNPAALVCTGLKLSDHGTRLYSTALHFDDRRAKCALMHHEQEIVTELPCVTLQSCVLVGVNDFVRRGRHLLYAQRTALFTAGWYNTALKFFYEFLEETHRE